MRPSRFCPQCHKEVQPLGNRCPDCNLMLNIEEEKGHFLSGDIALSRTWLNFSPGDKLMKRFKIKRCLGTGRFGKVYLAEDDLLTMEVALKATEIGPLSQDIALLHLKREKSIHSRISDFKPVIKFHDIHYLPWGGTGLLLLSMEYANGGNLRKWLLEHHEDFEERRACGLRYFKQACLGVKAVHDVGVVHLDLKPENLLIQEEIIKVSDFGLSQTFLQMSTTGLKLLKAGLGTPCYMAPEQIMAARPKDVDQRADIYALGCILFELLDGEPAYVGTPQEILAMHTAGIKPKLTGVNDSLAKTIWRCLETDAAKRFGSVKELLEALEGKDWNKAVKDLEAAINSDHVQSARPLLEKAKKEGLPTDVYDRLDARLKNKEEIWQARRKSMMEYVRKGINSGQLEVAEKMLSALREHIGDKPEKDKEYETLSKSMEKASKLRKIEELAFAEANSKDNEAGWREFLEAFPKGKHAEEARYRLQTMERKREEERKLREQKMREALMEKEFSAQSVDQLVELAKDWIEDLHSISNARNCLEMAEQTAMNGWESWKNLESTQFWSDIDTIGKAWIEVLDDKKKAKRCIRRFEIHATDYSDWVHFGNVWKTLFNDQREIRICLKNAEGNINYWLHWIGMATSWKEMLNDDREARRCLKKAETYSTDHSNKMTIAKCWKKILNDSLEAERCLLDALKWVGRNCIEWLIYSAAWKSVLDDDGKAREFMQEAEIRAQDFIDWSYCAEYWKSSLGNDREARRCMQEAEKRVENDVEWERLAWYRQSIFNDDP